jgi:beta-glucosidase
LNTSDLASFDTKSESWTAEAGKYAVKIGSSSTKIRLSSTFGLANDIAVEKVNKVLSPQVNINEYKTGNSNASGFIYDLNGFVAISK